MRAIQTPDGRSDQVRIFRLFLVGCLVHALTNVAAELESAAVLQSTLIPRDNPEVSFGASPALSGEFAVVGASVDDTQAGESAGSVYIYRWNGTNWTHHFHLSPDVFEYDYFGGSVALAGDTLVVGASGDDSLSWNSGSAYVFKREGITWGEEGRLFPEGGEEDVGYAYFGSATAISEGTILVGQPGTNRGNTEAAAYIFVHKDSVWQQQAKLTPETTFIPFNYGGVVALSGDTALVGWSLNGGAYVFVRDGTGWHQQAELVANDQHISSVSLALSGDTAVIGTTTSLDVSGLVYVFKREGTNWNLEAKLRPPGILVDGQFGLTVSLSNGTAMISSSHAAAYLFSRIGTNWVHSGTIPGAISVPLTLEGNTALVRDPLGTSSQPSVLALRLKPRLHLSHSGSSITISLHSALNSVVALETSTSLTGNWLPLREVQITQSPEVLTLPIDRQEPLRFYRALELSK